MIHIGSTKVLAGVRALIKAKERTDDAVNNATVEGMDLEVIIFPLMAWAATGRKRGLRQLPLAAGGSAADTCGRRVGSHVQRCHATGRRSALGTGTGKWGAEGD